jgi:ketosteroid isomerase-like protein
MKKFNMLITVFLLFQFNSSGQTAFHQEINDQVWKPFIQSFANNDQEILKQIYSPDFIRVVADDDRILGYAEFLQSSSDPGKWASWQSHIELRFIKRIVSPDKAFEVGFYKTTSVNSVTKETRISYGKFHVLLRKEKGSWKILMDEDARENANEQSFLSADPM